MIGIYLMICDPTGDTYIGGSNQIEQRYRHHLSGMRGRDHGNPAVVRLAVTHGPESFRCEVLELCKEPELKRQEWFWMAKLRPSLNICVPDVEASAKAGALIWRKTDEARRRQSERTAAWYAERRRNFGW
jgi:group I intron endonuclease